MKTASEPKASPSEGFRRREKAADKVRKKEISGAFYLVVSEVLFTLSPFIAIGMVFYFKERSWRDLLSQRELALAASVLNAQAVVKLVAGLLSSNVRRVIRWQLFTAAIAVVIVVGIIPSLIVLSFILNSEGGVSAKLVQAQWIWLLVGFIFFVASHYTGEILRAWGKYWDDTQFLRFGDIPETQAEYNARIEIERLRREAKFD